MSVTVILAFIFGGSCGCTAHPKIRHAVGSTCLHGCKVILFSRPMRAVGRGIVIAGYAANPYTPPLDSELIRYNKWRRSHPETEDQAERTREERERIEADEYDAWQRHLRGEA